MTNATTQITSNAAQYLTGSLNAALTLDDYAGEFAADFDMDAANAEYQAACEAVLATYRPDWTVCGNFIFGPFDDERLDEDEHEALLEDIAAIDAAAILARHEINN